MILELSANDKITLRFSLIESEYNVKKRIEKYTEELNASKNIKEVRTATLSLEVQREKLQSITNLLNKLYK
tara:strand:+ start:1245 stop:1457 length:213 start_codon:yes stop_codon:yes gene_type:complete